MDTTTEENARQINCHQRFVEDFEKQDQWLLEHSIRNRKVHRERRQRCFIFQLVNLISGIWGTYNGIYTRQQLDQLHKDLTKVEEHQDQLFAVTSAHQTAILQLDTSVSAILDLTLRQMANPSSITDVTLQWLIDMLEQNVGKANRAIQAAQMWRLSVDFLNVDQLHDLHARCPAQLEAHHWVSFGLLSSRTILRLYQGWRSTRAAHTYGTDWCHSTIDEISIDPNSSSPAKTTSQPESSLDWTMTFSPSLTEKKDFLWK